MSSFKFEEVCNFCYKLSSHKASPTYTFKNKASGDPLACSVCRQKWQSQIVARSQSGKVVPVRPRPAIPAQVDYTYCVSITKGIHCFKGPQCTFAHHEGELVYWCQERARKEPRPNPPAKSQPPYTICKAVQDRGLCNYGVRCTFAHSEEEVQLWRRAKGGGGAPYHPPPPSVGPFQPHPSMGGAPFQQPPLMGGAPFQQPHMGGGPGPPAQFFPSASGAMSSNMFVCNLCNIKCTGQKQLDEHLKGSVHQKAVRMMEPQIEPPRGPMLPLRQVPIRPRPVLNFQIDGYRVCMHASRGRYCQFGDACTFAHSPEELEAWNQELRMSRQRPPLQVSKFLKKSQMETLSKDSSKPLGGVRGTVPNGGARGVRSQELDDLDDFEDDLSDIDAELDGEEALEDGSTVDLADEARLHLDSVWRKNQDAIKLMGPTEGVFVQEVTGTPLALKLAKPTQDIRWTFQVTAQAAKMFKCVVLFDALGEDFTLHPIVRFHSGRSFAVGGASSKDGKGEEVNQVVQPGEMIVVKVSVKPTTGIKEQVVVFLFADFLIVKPLKVEVLSEEAERGLRLLQKKANRRPVKKDLYWECHYNVLEYIPDLQEPTDSSLKEYKLPEKIEQFIEEKRYDNMERTVTKENYVRRLHNLLFLEEYQQRSDMSRYDLTDVTVQFVTNYSRSEQLNIAPSGTFFLRLDIDEELFEGRRSIKPGDVALMLPAQQKKAFGCAVEHVGREDVVLKVSTAAKEQCALSGNRASFRFTVYRTSFKAMHYAVDYLDLDVIFPTITGPVPLSFRTQECLRFVDKCALNKAQKDAVRNVLDPAYQSIPTLVCGPFGCGKTRTLRECIKLLLQHAAGTKILLTTQSNSAADLYVEDLHKELNDQLQQRVYRLYYIGRNPRTVSPVVMKYTRFENGRFVCPEIETLKKYRLIVTTLQTARTLKLKGFKKDFFTHVFIDEAAQALEAEALIPLSMANKMTKLVLAGDKMQMNPSVYSGLSRKYGLGQSLLDRLYDDDVYRQKDGLPCKVELNENHRSHPQILEVPSKLFYSNSLVAKASLPPNGPQDIPPVGFVGVDGQEKRDEDSPSFLNLLEAEKVAAKAEEFCTRGLRPSEVCVLTLYKRQVELIRWLLRQKKLAQVSVLNIEGVQGLEYRALILSTVRTCTTEPGDSDEGSFLSSPKLFNTAITRACQWLLVVGEPITLCSVGSNRTCWLEFIKKCISLNSFVYPSPQRFEAFLENRLITKHIVQAIKPAELQPSEGVQVTEVSDILLESFSKLDLRARRTVVAERVGSILKNASQEVLRNVTDHLMYKYSTAEPLVRLLNTQTELEQTVQALNPQTKFPSKPIVEDDTDSLDSDELLDPHPVPPSVGPSAAIKGPTKEPFAHLQDRNTISDPLLSGPTPAVNHSMPPDMQRPAPSLLSRGESKMQQVYPQLSLLLHQERSVLLQQRGLLEQLSAAEMPLEVQPKVQRSRELVQQQLKLLDEQTTTMTELMQCFPMARNVGILPGPRNFSAPSHQLPSGPFQRVPLRSPHFAHFGQVPRLPMGMGMSALPLPRPQPPGSNMAPQNHHDLDWDDL